jgi:hypothetical protein
VHLWSAMALLFFAPGPGLAVCRLDRGRCSLPLILSNTENEQHLHYFFTPYLRQRGC